MFGAVAFTSVSDSPLGICLSPLLLLLSLDAAFPIYSLKPCPLLICSSCLPLIWEKDARGWSGGEFISLSLNKISEFHSAQVLESILLLYKKLWACFKMVFYSPTVTPSPHPTPEPKAPFFIITMRTCGGSWRKSSLDCGPQDVLALNWSHWASRNLSKLSFKSSYWSMEL